MNKITLDDIIEHIGQPAKKQSGELLWQCPYCLDKGHDNLKYNTQKQVLYCFADSEHSKMLLSEINKKKFANNIDVSIPQYLTKQTEYLEYQIKCNNDLLNNEKALAYLEEKRGIKKYIVDITGMGFDFDKKKWVIPVFNNGYIIGFEYRGADFTKKRIWREKDTKRCLANIYGREKADTIYLVEGFLDSYVLLQMLKEHNKADDVAIASVSNGVNGTLAIMPEIKFNNFDKIKLLLDNDEAGDVMTERVLNKYPFVVDSRQFLKDNNVKDVTDYYLLRGKNG